MSILRILSFPALLLIASFLFLLNSCTDDIFQSSTDTTPQFVDVDERLWSYYKSFEEEGRKRGFNYDLNALEITGSIESIAEQGVAGTCQYGSHIHDVTIDLEFWNSSSERLREFVVFHELGHCVLSRGHSELQFNNGICRSIMRSGLENCRDAYTQENRNYYLDELFTSS